MIEMGAQPEPSKEIEPGLRSRFLEPQNILFGFLHWVFQSRRKELWMTLSFHFFSNFHNYSFSQPMHYFSNAYYTQSSMPPVVPTARTKQAWFLSPRSLS